MSDFRKLKPDVTRREMMTAMAVGALAASAPGRAFAERQADAGHLDPVALQSLSRRLEKGRRSLRQIASARDHVTLVSEGNSEKGIADIKRHVVQERRPHGAELRPNDTPDARPIVESCFKAGAYVVTQWNKPATFIPKTSIPTTSPTSNLTASRAARRSPRA